MRPAFLIALSAGIVFAGSVFASDAAAPFDHFEPAPEGHSWIDAYLLATASGNAYRGRAQNLEGEGFVEKFQHLYTPLGLTVLAFIESEEEEGTGTQSLVLQSDDVVLVVFSGSEGHDDAAAMRDWLTNASIWPLEVAGVRVHRGFHYALESVWEELDAAVAGPLEGGRALWITGHSLGGALANLAAYRWRREQVPVAGVYTFAAPKIGDAAFVDDFQQRLGARSQQWSTTLDPVPRLPELTTRTAFEKLGVTNMVHASGKAELDTSQRMSSVPNPMAHRVGSYVNYLYRALPADVRERVPRPPALCALYTQHVGIHPDDGYPLCRDRFFRTRRGPCLESGREIVERRPEGGQTESWCVAVEPGKFRYLAQKLKPKRPSASPSPEGPEKQTQKTP